MKNPAQMKPSGLTFRLSGLAEIVKQYFEGQGLTIRPSKFWLRNATWKANHLILLVFLGRRFLTVKLGLIEISCL
jgi:hypothetical protein